MSQPAELLSPAVTWLIISLGVSLFVAVGISVRKLNQDEKSATVRELNEAAATLGLLRQPTTGRSGAQVFSGTVQGLEVTWTITPKSVGRAVRIRIRGATPESSAESAYDDNYNDASQLVPATRRLLERVVQA